MNHCLATDISCTALRVMYYKLVIFVWSWQPQWLGLLWSAWWYTAPRTSTYSCSPRCSMDSDQLIYRQINLSTLNQAITFLLIVIGLEMPAPPFWWSACRPEWWIQCWSAKYLFKSKDWQDSNFQKNCLYHQSDGDLVTPLPKYRRMKAAKNPVPASTRWHVHGLFFKTPLLHARLQTVNRTSTLNVRHRTNLSKMPQRYTKLQEPTEEYAKMRDIQQQFCVTKQISRAQPVVHFTDWLPGWLVVAGDFNGTYLVALGLLDASYKVCTSW